MRDLKNALLRTADWLEAHPDQHIAGARVIDPKTGNHADYACFEDRKEELCYCAIGRLGVELGLPLTANSDAYQVNDQVKAGTEIEIINDQGVPSDAPLTNRRGNPAVIPYLRELAASC